MNQIVPGVWHWSAEHPRIGIDVSSYYLPEERVLIDPVMPPEGLKWFEEHGAPEHILMSNRHHDRSAWEVREAFGSTVHCIRNGMHELDGRGPVEAFDFGQELPGGITPHEIDAICPDETALHIPARRALVCADGVVHYDNALGFVPDELMDDPQDTKSALREAYRRVLDLDFHVLLLAHGQPLTSGGKEALQRFAQGG